MQLFGFANFLLTFLVCIGFRCNAVTRLIASTDAIIGIRQVLGASIGNVIYLLSADFVKLVLIAIVIASPIAWWAMHQWLESFSYHIDIQWWIFAAAGSVVVMIALLTVSWQATRAALANPVDSLRDE